MDMGNNSFPPRHRFSLSAEWLDVRAWRCATNNHVQVSHKMTTTWPHKSVPQTSIIHLISHTFWALKMNYFRNQKSNILKISTRKNERRRVSEFRVIIYSLSFLFPTPSLTKPQNLPIQPPSFLFLLSIFCFLFVVELKLRNWKWWPGVRYKKKNFEILCKLWKSFFVGSFGSSVLIFSFQFCETLF